jgi:hypothetical protein
MSAGSSSKLIRTMLLSLPRKRNQRKRNETKLIPSL